MFLREFLKIKIVLEKNYDTGTEGDFMMKRAALF